MQLANWFIRGRERAPVSLCEIAAGHTVYYFFFSEKKKKKIERKRTNANYRNTLTGVGNSYIGSQSRTPYGVRIRRRVYNWSRMVTYW